LKKNSRPRQDDPTPLLTRGVALQQSGDLDGALACYAEVLKTQPRQADALHLSGIIATQQGRPADAVELIAKAIAGRPNNAMYHVNMANALEAMGREDRAEEHLRRAIDLDASFAPAYYNLGNLLARQNRDGEAIACYDRAVYANPAHFAACLALGELLLKRKQAAPAYQLATMALKLAPADSRANDLLIGALLLLKNFPQALERLESVLSAAPENLSALKGKIHCLQKLARVGEAIVTCRTLLELAPGDVAGGLELARLLVFSGQVELAIDGLSQLAAQNPGDSFVFSTWLFYLNYQESRSAVELRELHQQWADRQALPARKLDARRPGSPQKKIKLGYLSADFKSHSVAAFIESVLEFHDREKFEVFAYYLGTDADVVTERIRSKVDQFRFVHGQSAEEIARQISDDGIDIAIDLGAHTTAKLLDALLLRPAPVQFTWLGYPNTTGVSTIDYRISDAIADPPGIGDTWNSERLARLPDCFHCYRPEQGVPFDPAPAYVRNGFVTFGSFNVLPKLSPSCLAAWGRIINATPDSRLLIKTRFLGDASVRQQFLEQCQSHGLAADRIIIAIDQPGWIDHISRYREVDIGLDPFPYNGTTTTCEALWMGVPVLTFMGQRHASRVGASLLAAVGHPELIAGDMDAYVAKAIDLANQPEQIGALHSCLRDDMAKSPLCDAPRFVGHLEAAFLGAWKTHNAALA
jgi:predicted O-linked N-acetylglucosamine transferase (SPINDLY family)